jgi:hypothetical protein
MEKMHAKQCAADARDRHIRDMLERLQGIEYLISLFTPVELDELERNLVKWCAIADKEQAELDRAMEAAAEEVSDGVCDPIPPAAGGR